MRTRTIPLTVFRLNEFIEAYAECHRWCTATDEDGSLAVYLLDGPGDTPTPSHENRILEAELVENGKLVFLPFHEPMVGDQVKCLDGSVYVENEDVPKLDIGEADAYGYLMELRQGDITIRGALYDGSSGPVPTLEVQEECGVFDERMDDR
jgi:hypothetical protein